MKEDRTKPKIPTQPKIRKIGLVPEELVGQIACSRSDGSHYPDCEKIVQEFWDYDEATMTKLEKFPQNTSHAEKAN